MIRRFALSSFGALGVCAIAIGCGGAASDEVGDASGGTTNDGSTDQAGSGGNDGTGPDGGSDGGTNGSGGAGTGGDPSTGGASTGGTTGGAAGAPADGGSGSETCTDGDTMPADDGCNTCTCSEGSWACTQIGCGGDLCGGFAGFTCDGDEYCAYQEGDLCGAGDASAFCEPRPTGCSLEYAPVCGCDQMTYSNPCVAAAAGQGVYASGECH